MTDLQARADAAITEARLDAAAFRENTVYNGDGDPIRLIANANRLDWYAETIADLLTALSASEAKVGKLREALRQVMGWISSWSPDFTQDEEWKETAYHVSKALKDTDHDQG